MPITNLPDIWSVRYVDNFNSALVYGSITNRDYEGEAQYGASVKIPDFRNVNISVADYDEDTGLTDPGYVNHGLTSLNIDQYKAFNVRVDEIEQTQLNFNKVEALMRKSAQAMAQEQDAFIANTFAQAGSTIGDDLVPVALTADNIYSNLVAISTMLDENDVPQDERAIVLPPAGVALLRQADLFTRRDDVVVNGTVGEAAGFTIKMSNRVPNAGGAFKIIGAHPSAVSFVSQLSEIQQLQHPNYFGTQIRGLSIYGLAVTRPESMATLTATIA